MHTADCEDCCTQADLLGHLYEVKHCIRCTGMQLHSTSLVEKKPVGMEVKRRR